LLPTTASHPEPHS